MDVLGIDISKADFHACLLQGQSEARKSFPNAPAGYRQLQRWLKNRRSSEVHACMEATGAYWLGLAGFLHGLKYRVSVVNPARTSMFARSQLRRTKTDSVDAQMIAQFCKTQSPSSWTPPRTETLELRALLAYRRQMVGELISLRHLYKSVQAPKVLQRLHTKRLKSLEGSIDALEVQIRKHLKSHDAFSGQVEKLQSVSGIGFLTAASFIANLPVDRLRDGKAAAAYVGVTPRERQSGTSIAGKPRISKIGHSGLRRDLYLPAMTAMRFNPILRAFAERLKQKNKPPKVILIAVMRKMVVLAYGILRSTPLQAV